MNMAESRELKDRIDALEAKVQGLTRTLLDHMQSNPGLHVAVGEDAKRLNERNKPTLSIKRA